jgi:hypothetical protein
MVAGPGDGVAAAAAARGRLRVSHADREQVIDIVKAAFVRGTLGKDEFDLRVGQVFASRTYAELAAVTTDLPAEPAAAQPPRLARAEGEQPVLRPGPVMLAATTLCAGVWGFTFLPPWPANSEGDPPHALILLFFSANLMYLVVMIMAMGFMIAGWHEKRSGRRPPRRTAPGAGHPAVVQKSQ